MCPHIYTGPPGDPHPVSAPFTQVAPLPPPAALLSTHEEIVQAVNFTLVLAGTTID
jgi:hypothetical protein